ncbi:TIM barrel protein [Vibrio natriegens]|uniref:TIM barrel protein n=1 Tax=Vibrio natriegens TaxID=691 RepID=UPI001FB8921E|nr:TIM barrel protein [Vibrio natriegens]
MSNVQYGISPLTWTNDDMPELGGDIPLETCLSEMAEAGFTGTELGTKYPREPEVLIPLLEKHGLLLASGWYSGNLMKLTAEEEIAAMQEHIKLLKAAGCKAMVFGEVSNTVHGDINIMMELTSEAVYLTLDTGHITYGGGNPVTMIKRWGHRIGHMHFKDLRLEVMKAARDADKSFLNAVLDGVFTVPGTGDVDYDDVFAALKERNYQGWLLVEAEQDPAKAHPLTYAKTAYENITGYAKKYGL